MEDPSPSLQEEACSSPMAKAKCSTGPKILSKGLSYWRVVDPDPIRICYFKIWNLEKFNWATAIYGRRKYEIYNEA